MKRPADAVCEKCVLWWQSSIANQGECRADPPSPDGWPETTALDWCGAFVDQWNHRNLNATQWE